MTWVFGEFELHEDLFELRRAGARVALRRMPLRLLLHLARNSVRVVPADDLRKALWPGVVVAEVSLRQTVRALRRALNDESGQLIVSVRGVGYRLRIPVHRRATRLPGAELGEIASELGGGVRAGKSFLGRRAELGKLLACAVDAVGGRGQLALVTGSPGLGKTRLAQELASAVAPRMRGVWGRCWEDEVSPPFWPWGPVLRGIMGDDRASPRDLSPILLERGAGRARRDAKVIAEPEARFRLFFAAAARIRSQCQREPLLIVLDDLHATQEPALLLLKFLARELADLPLLIVGTYRAEATMDRPGCAAILESLPVSLHIALGGMAQEDVGAYLESVAGPRPDREVVSRLHQISGGNPLFLRELVRLYRAEMNADLSALDWNARSTGRLRDAIRRQLLSLSSRTRELLAAGSVIGSTFELATLRQVLGWSDGQVVECGRQAVSARVIGEISPGTFRFCHELTRDCLYQLSPLVRRWLHAEVERARALGRSEQRWRPRLDLVRGPRSA